MGKRSSRSRKGLSTAVGTAFFIIVVIISMSSMWAIGAFQARYQAVTQQMNEWDTERISENLNVRSLTQPVSKMSGQKYDINITVDNNGGVTVNIARIYVLDQNNNKLNVSDPMNLSATQPRFGFNHSTINTGEVSHVIPVSVTPNLASALSASHKCRIILTTDRGRQFSYAYPSPSGAGGGGYSITIDESSDNFQYVAGGTTFISAYSKPRGQAALYRLLLKNTTAKAIVLMSGCTMLQVDTSGSSTNAKYVVSDQTTRSNNLIAFSSQTINAGSSKYVYFAASFPGGTTITYDPNKNDWMLVGFFIVYEFEGDTTIYNLGTPVLTQYLT